MNTKPLDNSSNDNTRLSVDENKGSFQYIQLMSNSAPSWGFGGPIRLMYDYARWMADAKWTTTVIAGDVHHDFTAIALKTENLHGIHIKRIRVYWRSLVSKNINLVSPSLLWVAVWQIIHSSGRVFIHIDELRGLVPLYATIIKRLFPKKIIFMHSAFGMLHYKNSRLRRIYDRLFLKPMLQCIDLALAQNSHEAACYQEFFSKFGLEKMPMPIQLFPLHVATRQNEIQRDIGNRQSLRKQYDIPESAFVLIFLGRLHPEKGIIRTIDAFLQFKKEHHGLTYLLIVGRDDGMQSTIVEYIKTHEALSSIRVVNNVYDDRFDYYILADLFVGFPTIYEETMLASIEALSCGTPILVSREADIPFVEANNAGFVIDFSVESSVERIHQISVQVNRFSANAQTVSRLYFSEEKARTNLILALNKYV